MAATTQPTVIHRYQILELIGRGGMGALYLARDPLLERLVAIKLLREDIDSKDLRERFSREARAAARLSHVNIVTIYDVGEHEGSPFIAMEYVQGSTLHDLLRRKTLFELSQKLELAEALCSGLGVAHEAGIVHRDIKPANLMITPQGVLKILDFGIARLADSSLTQTRALVGTLNYMAPEQMSGEKVDARADIFAAGVVLYELLTLHQAFPGSISDGIFEKILNGEPQPIATYCPGIDPDICRIVETALKKDREQRYEDMTAMRKDIARVLQHLRAAGSGIDWLPPPTPRPDTPPPATPARHLEREMFIRRRAAEVGKWIESARAAMADQKYEEAIEACEQALFLDPDRDEASQLRERARTIIEDRQVEGLLDDAHRQFTQGALSAANHLIDQVLELRPASERGRQLRAAVEESRLARERELERRQAVERAMAAAKGALAQRNYRWAAQCANQALAIDPAWPEALAVKRQASEALEEERRAEEHQRAAEAVVAEARRQFEAGDCRGAVARLAAFQPAHPITSAALEELGREADRLEQERQRAEQERAERQRWLAGWLDYGRRSLEELRFEEAVEAVRQAQVIDPESADARALLERVETARAAVQAAEEARKAEEARRREAARLAEEARKADEARQREAARLAEQARKADEARQLEAARLAEEARKAEEVRLREAARQAEEARKAEEVRLREAARQAEEARKAEEARLREAARQAEEARKAQEAARAAAAREAARQAEEARKAQEAARAAAAREAARQAEEARKAQAAARAAAAREAAEQRKAEEARQRAAERQQREEEARQRAAEKQRRDEEARRAAAAARAAAEQQRREAEARRALERTAEAVAPESKEAARSPRRALVVGLAAAGLVVIAATTYWLLRPTPSPGPELPAASPVVEKGDQPAVRAPEPAPAQPQPANPPDVPNTPPVGRGGPGQKTEPPPRGDAGREALPPKPVPATPDKPQTPTAQPSTSIAKPAPVQAQEPAPTVTRPPVQLIPLAPLPETAAPSPAAARPAATPPPAPAAAPPSAAPTPPAPSAEDGVRDALRRYASAYESLNVENVRRVMPSVKVDQLAKAFAEYKTYTMTIEVGTIDVQGETARASCVVKQSFTAKVGRGSSGTMKSVFRLEKVGGSWIVAGIQR